MCLHHSLGIVDVKVSNLADTFFCQELCHGVVGRTEHRSRSIGILQCIIVISIFQQLQPLRVVAMAEPLAFHHINDGKVSETVRRGNEQLALIRVRT